MAHEENKTGRAAFWGAVAGGLVGLGLGLLIAPEEGQKVRRRLVYWLDHWSSQVSDYVEHMGEARPESEARRINEEVVAEATERAQPIMDELNALYDEAKRNRSQRQTSASKNAA